MKETQKLNSVSEPALDPRHPLVWGDRTAVDRRRLLKLGLRDHSLESIISEMRTRSKLCLQRRDDYDAAIDACLTTRRGWELYFSTFGSNPSSAPRSLRQQFDEALVGVAQALTICRQNMKASGVSAQRVRNVEDFVKNDRFRIKCLRLLHSKGIDAVMRAVEQRTGLPFILVEEPVERVAA